MAGMERFTQRARRVLSLAHQEADTVTRTVSVLNICFSVLWKKKAVWQAVYCASWVWNQLVCVRSSNASAWRAITKTARSELAPDTQQVLEYAVDEARRLGHHYIGTEHILLGLVRVDGTAMEVLRRLGVTADQIRRQTAAAC